MKKNSFGFYGLIGLLAVVFLTALTGCSNPVNPGKYLDPAEAMQFLGSVNKVYPAKNGARYYTGQIIEGFLGKKVRFEGNIVEYTSIKKSILDYAESLDSNNALMHQAYEYMVYDPSMKYVEFSSYTDVDTDEAVAYEVRIFFGNFLDTYNTSYWYAKATLFNPSFTVDLDSGRAVNFE